MSGSLPPVLALAWVVRASDANSPRSVRFDAGVNKACDPPDLGGNGKISLMRPRHFAIAYAFEGTQAEAAQAATQCTNSLHQTAEPSYLRRLRRLDGFPGLHVRVQGPKGDRFRNCAEHPVVGEESGDSGLVTL